MIRVGQITFVPTTPIVIRAGKHISPFQPPPKVILVGSSFLRFNRRRAERVGFSPRCSPTIPASRPGSSCLDQLLEFVHIIHSNSFFINLLKHFLNFSITLQNFPLYHKHNTFVTIPGTDTDTNHK